jgi:hypothetical protein
VNYTLLMQGDSLPMVGVLQLLLNRFDAKLKVDGEFGLRTLAAVKAFQREQKLKPDGIVGKDTWGQLTDGVSLPIVDAIDVWDDTFYKQDATDIKNVGGIPLLIGGACNGLDQMVSQICNAASNVFLLRFHGHGGPGVASVASGHGELDPDMKEGSDIFDDPKVLLIMSRLRSIFGPYGCVEFIECETGRGRQGRTLLSHLAAGLGVPITAAVNDQPFGVGPSFRLYGPTVTVTPRGNLRGWCLTLPEFPKTC